MTEDAPMLAREGLAVDTTDPEQLNQAIDLAVSYRGDVTISTVDGKTIDGYVFDRAGDAGSNEDFVRLIPTNDDRRVSVRIDRISALCFTGRDTAAGKSWLTWVQKYVEKKLAGDSANIESERLDEEGPG